MFASAAALLAADNSLGTWKLNVGKSDYSPAPLPYRSLTMVRTAVDSGVKTTVTSERLDGTRMDVGYTAKYDGAPYPIPGTGYPNDTISWRQIDANTFTSDRQKPGGKYHVIGRFVVSKDRKTMTNTLSGTDPDGKPTKATIVYERQ
ncbi:MAG: hypothetical protein JST11_03160 [Acidobacteria bacterium]|nr:hypothetical protein [Acidobacteriota bacterium]